MSVRGFTFDNGATTEQYDFNYLDNKPDIGSGLSTNDFTDAEKTKLAGIEAGATAVQVDPTPTQGSSNAVSSGGVYSAIEWVADEIEEFTGNYLHSVTTGKYITTNGDTVDVNSEVTNGAYGYAVIDCSEGDAFTITGKGGSTPRLYAFLGAESEGVRPVLDKADAMAILNDGIVVAPINAEKIVINFQLAYPYKIIIGKAVKKAWEAIDSCNDRITNVENNIEEIESVGINLFDKNNYNVINALLNASLMTVTTNTNAKTVYIPCEKNTFYTVSKVLSERFTIGCCAELPNNNVALGVAIAGSTETALTIKTDNTANYLCVWCYINTDTLTFEQIINTLQIQLGVNATAYANHKTAKDDIARLNVTNLANKISSNDLFNPNDYASIKAYVNGNLRKVVTNSNTLSVYIPCRPNTVYTVSKVSSQRFALASTSELPANDVVVGSYVSSNTAISLTIKTDADAAYLVAFVYHNTDTLSVNEIINSITIAEGYGATGIATEPLSLLPEYIVKTMAYKPMAKPNKGYMCLVSDDGKAGLATYAIPMIISKNVPLTLAVMSDSEVFDNDTMQATVIDAVENHGCEISQHGGIEWTKYTENGLNQFFDTEKAFFDAIGLTPKSAVIPAHYTTDIIKAVAGGRFGVVRSGYRGYNPDGTVGSISDYYDYNTSGEYSNLYGLSSFNISANSLSLNKDIIDYAYANNKVVIVYWHEVSLTAETKAVIEDSIDYAKTKGLEFITLSKLAHLIDYQRTN